MSVTSTTKRQETRSGSDGTPDRAPEKHEQKRALTVAELAYQIYEEHGRREGHDVEDWLEAERRLSNGGSSARRPASERSATSERATTPAKEAVRTAGRPAKVPTNRAR